MDSSPPATAVSMSPLRRESQAAITAFIPDPHSLFTVTQGVATGMPAASAACLAGPWPRPAGSTQPMVTSPTSSADRTLASNAPLMG